MNLIIVTVFAVCIYGITLLDKAPLHFFTACRDITSVYFWVGCQRLVDQLILGPASRPEKHIVLPLLTCGMSNFQGWGEVAPYPLKFYPWMGSCLKILNGNQQCLLKDGWKSKLKSCCYNHENYRIIKRF